MEGPNSKTCIETYTLVDRYYYFCLTTSADEDEAIRCMDKVLPAYATMGLKLFQLFFSSEWYQRTIV